MLYIDISESCIRVNEVVCTGRRKRYTALQSFKHVDSTSKENNHDYNEAVALYADASI